MAVLAKAASVADRVIRDPRQIIYFREKHQIARERRQALKSMAGQDRWIRGEANMRRVLLREHAVCKMAFRGWKSRLTQESEIGVAFERPECWQDVARIVEPGDVGGRGTQRDGCACSWSRRII